MNYDGMSKQDVIELLEASEKQAEKYQDVVIAITKRIEILDPAIKAFHHLFSAASKYAAKEAPSELDRTAFAMVLMLVKAISDSAKNNMTLLEEEEARNDKSDDRASALRL